jgi:excisionase family DNA binding protein
MTCARYARFYPLSLKRLRTTPDREETVRETAMRSEWLNYAKASEFTGLGRTTLWTLAATGQVRAAKVGKAVRFSRSSLQEFMEKSSYPGGR